MKNEIADNCHFLALIYADGRGVKQSCAKAEVLFLIILQ
jgi:hypothetical protein